MSQMIPEITQATSTVTFAINWYSGTLIAESLAIGIPQPLTASLFMFENNKYLQRI